MWHIKIQGASKNPYLRASAMRLACLPHFIPTDGTAGETTSHPTNQAKNAWQVVGYSYSTKPPRNGGQAAGYAALRKKFSFGQPNGHGNYAAHDNETRHARFPHPNPLPQAGEGANESLREFHVKGYPALKLRFLADISTRCGAAKFFAGIRLRGLPAYPASAPC